MKIKIVKKMRGIIKWKANIFLDKLKFPLINE